MQIPLIGGAGNDAYYVDNAGDTVTETANEGTDTVYSTVTYTLAKNCGKPDFTRNNCYQWYW